MRGQSNPASLYFDEFGRLELSQGRTEWSAKPTQSLVHTILCVESLSDESSAVQHTSAWQESILRLMQGCNQSQKELERSVRQHNSGATDL